MKRRGSDASISSVATSNPASAPGSAPAAGASPNTSDASSRLALPRWSRTSSSSTIDCGPGGSAPSAEAAPSSGAQLARAPGSARKTPPLAKWLASPGVDVASLRGKRATPLRLVHLTTGRARRVKPDLAKKLGGSINADAADDSAAAAAEAARNEVSLEEFQQRLRLPCAKISGNDAGHAAHAVSCRTHSCGIPPSWLPLVTSLDSGNTAALQEQESDTDWTEDDMRELNVQDCEDCEEMVAGFPRAPDDGFAAQQHPAEWAFPCADADGGLESYQPSAGFMQAFSSDLSDLMEL
eukprot:Tamp_12872.p1 GENE.Tamp_12872~~Tamp_12872.p1  ORF type:complete len:296 (-),score=54.65 Tamp_12872:335-1222(-)